MYGRIFSPTSTPRTLPPAVARNAYPRYFDAMEKFPYPKAFIVPISILCSSTIRVIPVRLINAATRKNITGNTFPIARIRSAFSPNPSYSISVLLSYTYHFGFLIWLICLPASASFFSPFAISASDVFFPSSYSFLASASFASFSAISASPFFSVCSCASSSAFPASNCFCPDSILATALLSFVSLASSCAFAWSSSAFAFVSCCFTASSSFFFVW